MHHHIQLLIVSSILQSKEADDLTRRVTDLQLEVKDGQETVQRNKANAEAYHRRNEKLQGLLEAARKEVEDLQVGGWWVADET
jgi:chromosome segregation ATPase